MARDDYELEHHARYAIEGDCARAQMTGLNGGGVVLPSLPEACELRSGENAQELDSIEFEVHRT